MINPINILNLIAFIFFTGYRKGKGDLDKTKYIPALQKGNNEGFRKINRPGIYAGSPMPPQSGALAQNEF